MISPTGLGIRNDSEGSGEYGASRGDRIHNGIDFLCIPGKPIVAPFDLVVVRVSYPTYGLKLSGIEWKSGRSHGKLFYFTPDPDLIGCTALSGHRLGIAQDVGAAHGLPNMKPHIHFQIDK